MDGWKERANSRGFMPQKCWLLKSELECRNVCLMSTLGGSNAGGGWLWETLRQSYFSISFIIITTCLSY